MGWGEWEMEEECKCLCLLAWKLFPHSLTEMCPPSLIQVWNLVYFIRNIPPFSKKWRQQHKHCHIKETTDHMAAADLTSKVLVHLNFEVGEHGTSRHCVWGLKGGGSFWVVWVVFRTSRMVMEFGRSFLLARTIKGIPCNLSSPRTFFKAFWASGSRAGSLLSTTKTRALQSSR